ncbi:MAG: hypothetical protein M3Y46_11810 [Actinomycetota bacterium]|nr:hypothetical protein [Actinomycetota bacterium]
METVARTRGYALLRIALVLVGVIMMLFYPIALVWPSGWVWHHGAPHESEYFLMIAGIYATLGVFLIIAARTPEAHLSLIWFVVWSSVVHAAIMAVLSFREGHLGHLWGDVTALLVAAVLLAVLVISSGLRIRDAPTHESAPPR